MKYFKQATIIAFTIAVFLLINHGYKALIDDIRETRKNDGNRPTGNNNNTVMNFWISNYVRFHDANRHNASARYAVFLPVTAGFGDNVIGMMNMYAYSVLTRRVFLIHSVQPQTLQAILSAKAVERFISNEKLDGNPINNNNNNKWYGPKLTYHYYVGLSPEMIDLLRSNLKYVALHMSKAQWLMSLVSKLRSPVYKDIIIPEMSIDAKRAAAKLFLEPSDAIKRDLELKLKEYKFWGGGNGYGYSNSYISVHARLGAGTGEGKHRRFARLQGKEKILATCLARRVKIISGNNKNKAPNVFLATDTVEFKEIFRRAITEKNILPLSNVRFTNVRNVTHYRSKKLERSSIVDMNIENLLIANAQHIVALNSGFADIAYWRGSAESFTRVSYESCGV